MNSLFYKTLTITKTLNFRPSSFSLSYVNFIHTPKYPSSFEEQPIRFQGAMAMEDSVENGKKVVKDCPRPSEIPFQSKVANAVNLIGKVQKPVKFITLPNGKSWAGTVISHESINFRLQLPWNKVSLQNYKDPGVLLQQISVCDEVAYSRKIPIIFEGDLAHTAATHLKVPDIVYVAGHLTPDPLPINLKNDQVDVQVMVRDLHFVRGYHKRESSKD